MIDGSSLNLSYYNVYLQSLDVKIETTGLEFYLHFNSPGTMDTRQVEMLVQDIKLMNEIRMSSSPGVKDLYDQMLTMLALTKPTGT